MKSALLPTTLINPFIGEIMARFNFPVNGGNFGDGGESRAGFDEPVVINEGDMPLPEEAGFVEMAIHRGDYSFGVACPVTKNDWDALVMESRSAWIRRSSKQHPKMSGNGDDWIQLTHGERLDANTYLHDE